MVDVDQIEAAVDQGLAHIDVCIVDFCFFVQHRRVEGLAVLVLFNEEAFDAGLAEDATGDGVAHRGHKLAVLVVCDFGFVHEERLDLHFTRLGGGLRTVGHVLRTGSHGVVALVDEDHSFEVDVLKVRAIVDAYKLSVVGTAAAYEDGCRGGEHKKQLLHIIHVFCSY